MSEQDGGKEGEVKRVEQTKKRNRNMNEYICP